MTTETRFTEQDTQTLATKLAEFATTLTPGERAAFEVIEEHMTTTVGTGDETIEGYTMTGTATETTTTTPTETTTTTRTAFWNTVMTTLTTTQTGTTTTTGDTTTTTTT
jgi:hypothetical protein